MLKKLFQACSKFMFGNSPAACTGAAAAVIEALEDRKFFSVSTWAVPSGSTTVRLDADLVTPLAVDVRINGSSTIAHTFTETVGDPTNSYSLTSTIAGLQYIDAVGGANKPNGGISFIGGTGSSLEVDAAAADQEIDVAPAESSSSYGSLVKVAGVVSDSCGSGVANITIVANDAGGATVNVESNTPATLTVNTGAGTYDTINLGEGDGILVGAVVNTGAGNDTVNLTGYESDDLRSATVDFGDTPGLGNALAVEGYYSTLYLPTPQAIDTVTLDGGTIQMNQTGTMNLNTFGAMSIIAGVVDLGAQKLLVTNTDAATVVGYVGRAAEPALDWLGSGITSSYAIADPGTYGVGYATSADNGLTGFSLAAPGTGTTGEVLIRPTVSGDASLDGTVDITDLNVVLTNYGLSPTTWGTGDFTFAGTTNITDLNIILSNYGNSFPT